MQTLVIGYGNTLRGDDGVGYCIAEQIEAWQIPTMKAIACHQLTPDLAAEIAEYDRVFFVDATLPGTHQSVTIQPLLPSETPASQTHHSTPASLLTLTKTLYQAYPEAYQILIPTVTMDFGETLSERTEQAMQQALQQLCDR